MIIYVDTSAALKLLVEEPESAALAGYLTIAAADGHQLVASMLLYTELHCASQRRAQIPPALVNAVLSRLNLVDLTRLDLMYAAAIPGRLRSADAIHLAAAVRLQTDVLVAYDSELVAASVQAGVSVSSPV